MFWERLAWDLYRFFAHYPTKILLAEMLFCVFAPRRKYFWLRFIPCATVLVAIPFITGYYSPWVTIGENFTFSFLIEFVLSMGLIYFCFRFSWQQTVVYCSSAYAIEHCFDSCRRIVNILLRNYGVRLNAYMRLFLYLGIMSIVFALCYFLFVKQIKKMDNSVLKNKFVIIVSVATILVTNILSVWLDSVGYDVYHKLYDIIACVLLLVMHYTLFYIFELVKKNEVMRYVLEMNEEQHKLAKENIELINLKCHDIKHQIAGLRELTNNEKIKESLQSLEESVIIYDSIVKTGNSTLDAILTEKKLYCERYRIRFSCIVDGAMLDFMEEEDVYALFGNALDNAIESVMSLNKEDERMISIKVSLVGQMLSIHFDNYCEKKIVWKGGFPMSTKNHHEVHGYGMRSIRHVVEKYGGTMNAFQKEDTFNLNILFPLSEQASAK